MLTTYSYKEIETQRGESHVPRSTQPADGNPGTSAPDSVGQCPHEAEIQPVTFLFMSVLETGRMTHFSTSFF